MNTPVPESQKTRLPTLWIVLYAVAVFGLEFIVMFFLDEFLALPEMWFIFLDSFLLVVVLFPLGYFFVMRPVLRQMEEKQRANAALHKSQDILDHFFSVSELLIAYMDSNFNFIRVNQAYADSDERPAEALIGKNHFDLYPNEENRQIFQSVVDTGKPFSIIDKAFVYAENPERGITYWDWNLFPIKNVEGKVTELLLVLTNVTERHNSLLAIAERDRQFRALFDQTYHFNFLLDQDGVVLMINKSGLDFLQVPTDQLYGRHIWESPNLIDRADEVPLRQSISEASAGQIVRRDYKLKAPDGSVATLDTTLKSIINSQGKAELLLLEALDITQRVKIRETLKRNEEKMEELYIIEKRARESADHLRNAVLAFADAPDIDSVLDTLLTYLSKATAYEVAHLLLFDENNMLVVSHAHGEEKLAPGERLLGKSFDPEDLYVLNPLFRDHSIISVPDTTGYSPSAIMFQSFPIGSWIGFPLIVGSELIGVCVLEHSQKQFFSSDLPQWAYTLVNQSAVSIQNAWLFEQVNESRERLQALSRRLVQVQEKERHYVAQELHDEAGQMLASLKVGLKLLEGDRTDPDKVARRSKELNTVVDEVLENLHRLAMDLRPAALDHLGLVAALRQQTELLSQKTGLEIHFEVVGHIDRLSTETETAIYRIVQEALTNVVKHAKATRVDVLFERRRDNLLIIVEDNGIGFSPDLPSDGHLGTIGMSERAEMLGGSLRIESAPNEGSAVFLEVPCPSES